MGHIIADLYCYFARHMFAHGVSYKFPLLHICFTVNAGKCEFSKMQITLPPEKSDSQKRKCGLYILVFSFLISNVQVITLSK